MTHDEAHRAAVAMFGPRAFAWDRRTDPPERRYVVGTGPASEVRCGVGPTWEAAIENAKQRKERAA